MNSYGNLDFECKCGKEGTHIRKKLGWNKGIDTCINCGVSRVWSWFGHITDKTRREGMALVVKLYEENKGKKM